MHRRRSLIKRILSLFISLGVYDMEIGCIELIKNEDGRIVGYKIEFKAEKERLTLIRDTKKD